MKKYFCIALLLVLNTLVFAQDIFIGGINKNRPLTWSDFKGTPDATSGHHAFTVWNITYSLSGISLKENTVKIGKFLIKLEFDENQSWVKPGKQTDLLLKHEQGHFNLGLICQREIIQQLNNAVFFKTDFQQKIQNIFSSTLEKYHQLGLKYDAETNHSINQSAQDNWNNFFASQLN